MQGHQEFIAITQQQELWDQSQSTCLSLTLAVSHDWQHFAHRMYPETGATGVVRQESPRWAWIRWRRIQQQRWGLSAPVLHAPVASAGTILPCSSCRYRTLRNWFLDAAWWSARLHTLHTPAHLHDTSGKTYCYARCKRVRDIFLARETDGNLDEHANCPILSAANNALIHVHLLLGKPLCQSWLHKGAHMCNTKAVQQVHSVWSVCLAQLCRADIWHCTVRMSNIIHYKSGWLCNHAQWTSSSPVTIARHVRQSNSRGTLHKPKLLTLPWNPFLTTARAQKTSINTM